MKSPSSSTVILGHCCETRFFKLQIICLSFHNLFKIRSKIFLLQILTCNSIFQGADVVINMLKTGKSLGIAALPSMC